MRECRAFIAAIRKACGEEPEGARLRVERENHEAGDYYEVAVEFDETNESAIDYAMKCDGQAPTTWAEAGMEAPVAPNARKR